MVPPALRMQTGGCFSFPPCPATGSSSLGLCGACLQEATPMLTDEQGAHCKRGDSSLRECSTKVPSLLIEINFKHQISNLEMSEAMPRRASVLFLMKNARSLQNGPLPRRIICLIFMATRSFTFPNLHEMKESGFSKVNPSAFSIY